MRARDKVFYIDNKETIVEVNYNPLQKKIVIAIGSGYDDENGAFTLRSEQVFEIYTIQGSDYANFFLDKSSFDVMNEDVIWSLVDLIRAKQDNKDILSKGG